MADEDDPWLDRLRHVLGRLWSLRSLLADHRALPARYGANLRLVTPGFLLLVGSAAWATVVLGPGTGLDLPLAWAL